jgi:Flp pilus assembly CpaF family ATPase
MTGAMATIDDGAWTAIKHTYACSMRTISGGSPTLLEDLVAFGSITAAAARFLVSVVSSGLNVLASGGTRPARPSCWIDSPRQFLSGSV